MTNSVKQENPNRPVKIYSLPESRVSSAPEPFYNNYQRNMPIAIDLGSSAMRIGQTHLDNPCLNFPSVITRYRERKSNRNMTFVGNDCYLDPGFKAGMKYPFDGSLITNWDCIEWMLDYSFQHMGVNSSYGVENPVIMNELLATPQSQRSNMMQLLFEAYNIPKLVFGVSDLFSFHYNNRNNSNKSGLVIGCGNQSTNVIPVINDKPILEMAKRINWGGEPAVDYLSKSIALKYPFFPSRLTHHQFKQMFTQFSYFSDDYNQELEDLMTLDYLREKDIVVETQFTEVIHSQKTAEELAKQQEKRREQGRRLQQQAQKARLEKLIEKEADFKYYTEIRDRLFNSSTKISKKQIVSTLTSAGFDDEADFRKYLANLEKSLKKARNQDIGDSDDLDQIPSFHLLDINDEELSEEQLKEKKSQKLQKANYEARMKAREEKAIELKRKQEQEAKEAAWRERDLNGWINDKRAQLNLIVDRKKQREKLKAELNDRKSHAAQIRMKNIANLAADGNAGNKNASTSSLSSMNNNSRNKRTTKRVTIDNDPNDTFGANDDDWMIYRDISKFEDEDELELEEARMKELEELLLTYDPNFSHEDLYNSEFNWKKSVVHKFLRGAQNFDAEDQHQQHQMHLNIERIKLPEIFIQPNIAGIDQVGISELSEDLILRRLPSANFYEINDQNSSPEIIQNIFLTGGCSQIANFENRIVKEFTSFLPINSKFSVKKAQDPIQDPWRGMKLWSASEECNKSYISKSEYEEMGPDYIKEHNLGNVHIG